MVVESCCHPNARYFKGQLDPICLDCLCRQISTLSTSEQQPSRFSEGNSDHLRASASIHHDIVECLAGFVKHCPDESAVDHYLISEALRSLLPRFDEPSKILLIDLVSQTLSREAENCSQESQDVVGGNEASGHDWLERTSQSFNSPLTIFPNRLKCNRNFKHIKSKMPMSGLVCLEVILHDEDCLTIFLTRHGHLLEDMVFELPNHPQTLSFLYRILKLSCVSDKIKRSQMKNLGIKDGFDLLFPHTLQIITNIIELVTEIGKPQLRFYCFDFLAKFFESSSTVYFAFHSSITKTLSLALSNSLIDWDTSIQKAIIRCLTAILVTSRSFSGPLSENSNLLDSMPQMLVDAELDIQSYRCLESNDPDLLFHTFQFYQRLCLLENFKYEKINTTLVKCLQAFSLNASCLQVDRSEIHVFFSECLSSMKPVDVSVQSQLLTVCSEILQKKGLNQRERLQFLKLVKHCRDSVVRGSLIDMIRSTCHCDASEIEIGLLKQFLILSKAIMECQIPMEGGHEIDLSECLKEDQFVIQIFGLLHHLNPEEDHFYVSIILTLLLQIRREDTEIPAPNLPYRTQDVFDQDTEITFQVRLPQVLTTSKWSTEILFEIAFLIRANLGLMNQGDISKLWLEFMTQLLGQACDSHFPEINSIFSGNYVIDNAHWNKWCWIEGLTNLPASLSNWNIILVSHEKQVSQDDNITCFPKKFVILASYYSFYIFAPNSKKDFLLSLDLLENLRKFVRSIPTSEKVSQQLCLYVKLIIFLTSCVWFEETSLARPIFLKKDISSWLEEFIFSQYIRIPLKQLVTFKWPTIVLLATIPKLPYSIMLEILEEWICENFEDFKLFHQYEAPYSKNTTVKHFLRAGGLQSALMNILIGEKNEAIERLIEFWHSHKLETEWDVFNFEMKAVLNSIFAIVFDIKYISGRKSQQDKSSASYESETDHMDQKLKQNLLSLTHLFVVFRAMKDYAVIDMEIIFPKGVIPALVELTWMNAEFKKIGELGLEFLAILLRSDNWEMTDWHYSVGSALVSDKKFMKFIENSLNFEESVPELSTPAYGLVSRLLDMLDSGLFHCPRINKITWSITYVLPYMRHAVTAVDHLGFLLSLLKCDFRSCLVEVKEIEDSRKLDNILKNLLFILGNMVYQISSEAKLSLVWKTLNEILNYLERATKGPLAFTTEDYTNTLRDFLFSAHLLVMIETYFFCDQHNKNVSNDVLEFLNSWLRLVNHVIILPDSPVPLVAGIKMRPFRLKNMLIRFNQWIGAVELDPGISLRTRNVYSIRNYLEGIFDLLNVPIFKDIHPRIFESRFNNSSPEPDAEDNSNALDSLPKSLNMSPSNKDGLSTNSLEDDDVWPD